MDKIILKNIRFYGYHGCLEEERKIGQQYFADLEIDGDLSKACKNDSLEDSIDYSRICRTVIKIGQTEKFSLIEALADQIANEILKNFPKAISVKIRISKPLPPMGEILESFAVEISRDRRNVDKK